MGLLDKTFFRGQTSNVKKGKDIQAEREAWEKERAASARPPEAKKGPGMTPQPMPRPELEPTPPVSLPDLPLDIAPAVQAPPPTPPKPEPGEEPRALPRVKPKSEPRDLTLIDQPLPEIDMRLPELAPAPAPAPAPQLAAEPAPTTEITAKSRLYNEAEALRKAGRIHEAELKYLDSIKEEEKEGPKASWRQTGPAPTRYESLAKMYYNTNRDDLALQVMDKYLAYCQDCGKDDLRMKKLRASMADSSLKRQIVKGWAYSVDEAGDSQAS